MAKGRPGTVLSAPTEALQAGIALLGLTILLASNGVCGARPNLLLAPLAPLGPEPLASFEFAVGVGFSPLALAKRTDTCQQDSHPCNELGVLGSSICCLNTQFCAFNESWTVGCCNLGVTCTKCELDQFLCNSTATITITTTTTRTGTGTGTVVEIPLSTPLTTTSLSTTCCPRLCTTSTAFLCGSGTGCCSFGSTCDDVDGACIATPTNAALAPSGDATPTSTPGGEGEVCEDGSEACEPKAVDSTGDGLSVGAKAGIGIGVSVVSVLVVGYYAWWVFRRRQKKRDHQDVAHGLEGMVVGSGVDSDEEDEERMTGSMSGGGGGRMGRRARRERERDTRTEISERSRTTTTNQYSTMGNIYIGPEAVRGPYTQTGGPDSPTVLEGHGLGASAAVRAGMPHGPDDVVAPVEIDGRIMEDRTERHPVTEASVRNLQPDSVIELPATHQYDVPDVRLRVGVVAGEADYHSGNNMVVVDVNDGASRNNNNNNNNNNNATEDGVDTETIPAASPGYELPTPSPFLSPYMENMDPLGTPSANESGNISQSINSSISRDDVTPNIPRSSPP